MNDGMFRQALHAAADDCLSGVSQMPSQRRAVFARIGEAERTAGRRGALVPVLAMILMLTIAGAAAAGLGLFGQLRAQKVDEVSYERLALLEDAAVTVGQTADLSSGAQLAIDQAYCDGRKLYYSYTLTAPDVKARMYVGDGARLADGAYMAPVDSWTESVGDTATASYYEVALPEGYAPGEAISFVLTVISHQADGSMKTEDVLVRVPVTGELRRLTGEGTADGYAAKAELFISDVDVSGSVRIAAPEDYWPESYKLVADGVEYRDIEGWSSYDGDAHVVHLRFDLPKTLEDAKLVPLDEAYAHEAIVLKGE